MTKIFVITVKGFQPATTSVRDQNATTAPARHAWKTGSLNWGQFMLQWFIRFPEFAEFTESSAPFRKNCNVSETYYRNLMAKWLKFLQILAYFHWRKSRLTIRLRISLEQIAVIWEEFYPFSILLVIWQVSLLWKVLYLSITNILHMFDLCS